MGLHALIHSGLIIDQGNRAVFWGEHLEFRHCSFSVLDDVLLPFCPSVHYSNSSSSRGSVSWIGGCYPQGAEDLVCGGGLAEPLLEDVERAGVGLVAIGLARVRDDDRPVLPVGCRARGGFDRDVGRDTDEHEGIDACHAENGVERGAVEPVCRLSPDDRLIGPGSDVVDDLNRGSTLQKSGAPDEGAKQRGVRPDPGQPRLIGDQGVDHLRLALRNPSSSRAWTPITPVFSARCRKSRLKGVSTWPATPLAICTTKRAVRAGSKLSMPCLLGSHGGQRLTHTVNSSAEVPPFFDSGGRGPARRRLCTRAVGPVCSRIDVLNTAAYV